MLTWAGSQTLGAIVTKVAEVAVGDQVKTILEELAKKFLVPNNAQYKDLGDSLGVGAAAFLQADLWDRCYQGLK